MAQNEVKIPVSLPGAGQAAADAQKVATGLNQIGSAANTSADAAKNQGKEAAETGKRLNELGEAGEKGAAAGRNLAQVLEGNVGALAMLGTQLKAVGAVIRANPFGAVFVVLTAGLALLPAITNFFRKIGGEAADSGEKAKNAFGEAKSQIEELNQAKLDALRAEIDSVLERSRALDEMGNRIDGVQKRMLAAQKAVALAEIEADKSMSPEQKTRARVEVEDRFARSNAQLEDTARNRAVDIARRVRDEAASAATNAEDAASQQRTLVENARRAPEDFRRVLAEVERQLSQVFGELRDPRAAGQFVELNQQRQQLEGTRDYLQQRIAMSASEPSQKTGTAQQQTLTALEAEARRARAAADAAERRLTELAGAAATDEGELAKTRGLEARARRIQAGIPEPVSRIAPGERTMFEAPGMEDTTPRVRDSASLLASSEKYGKMTGAEIAQVMEENNRRVYESTIAEVRRWQAAQTNRSN